MLFTRRPPLSTGDLFAVVGIVVAIMAIVFNLTWIWKTALVLFAMSLTVFAGRRYDSHPLLRIPIALVVVVIFSYATPWDAIADDFHKNFPLTAWPLVVKRPISHFALAAVGAAALLSSPAAFSEWRRYVFFYRSRVLSEQVWIDKETALTLIKASDWAKTRNQRTPWSLLRASLSGGTYNYDRDNIQFNRFIELTLHNFARRGNYHAREIDGIMKYDEGALRAFLDDALTADTLKRFGDLPE